MRKYFIGFSRRQVHHALRQVGRAVLALALLTTVVALVRPLRNGLGYLVLPGAWRPLSTYQILRLYWIDPAHPVEITPVQCDSIQGTLNRLPLNEMIAESFKAPVYDEAYFQNLQTHKDIYGTSRNDLNLMNSR
ncbi:hypothetical protein Btru_012704 [Bulinus truncatus]|nr:hypothetical protein Btru_012704 [Bulinus truncatus]